MPEAHSKWSASGFKKMLLCPGSKVLEAGAADTSSIYAAEGTAAHTLLEWVLTGDTPAAGYIGRVIEVKEADATYQITVDDDMADYIQGVADRVKDYQGDDGVLLVEQRLNYAVYLDQPEELAWGTGDVVILRGDEIIVIDLKYGRGKYVEVERNPQLMLYGLGAVQKFNGLAGDFERVRLVIDQPRISDKPSEWDTSVVDLEAWGYGEARSVVNTVLNAEASRNDATVDWGGIFLRPGEEQCQFCKAKATCPKLRAEVASTVFDAEPATPEEFDGLDLNVPDIVPQQQAPAEWLAACLNKVDLIESWCKAVRAEVERRLLAGESVPEYKVVPGKKGNRAWADAAEVEETMKAMRIKADDMYDRKLISPTTAEKLAKAGAIGPKHWKKLTALITQSEGKPHVAHVSDPRPALEIKPVTDDFVVESLDDLA